jgi:voltage-gated potassium channel
MTSRVDPGTPDERTEAPSDAWWVGLLNLAAVLVVYFVVPVQAGLSAGRLALNTAVALIAVAVVAWIVVREARRRLEGVGPRLRGLRLVLALEVVLVAFALVYFMLVVNGTGHFVGITTRIDALYFATVTTTTVGFGDIAPLSQVARALVMLQLVFNVAFIALVANLVRQGVQERAHGRDATTDP